MSSKYILTGHWGLGNSDDVVDTPQPLETVLGVISRIEEEEDDDNGGRFSRPLRYTIEHVGE